MLKVPFKPLIDNKEILAVKRVLKSGWLTSGKITNLAEKNKFKIKK